MPKPEQTVAGKPVIMADGPIINLKSGFAEKKLCDGPTFTTGTSCVYSCSFCYVSSFQRFNTSVREAMRTFERPFEGLVIRRREPVAKLEQALTVKGKPRFANGPKKVIYASPLVDVAATVELAKETLACCLTILRLTNWDIRLLSKSNLLPLIAKALPAEYKDRLIFGVSTGTFNDAIATAFESGTAKVSKRLESLYWLQDHGFRTFGMVCPSLPQVDYATFAAEAYEKIRAPRCEHVWAEVMNVRGESMTRTCRSLVQAGFVDDAARVQAVSEDKAAWEQYARNNFLGLTTKFPGDQLRFLQYVNKDNLAWWKEQTPKGAVLLGKMATEESQV